MRRPVGISGLKAGEDVNHHELNAHYRESQLLKLVLLALFCLLAWCADHYGRTVAGGFTERVAVVLEGGVR